MSGYGIIMNFYHEEGMKIGIEEAIFVFKIREISSDLGMDCVEEIGGHTWVRKTLNELVDLFPFWSKSQIRRVLASLKEQKAIVVEDLSENRWRRPAYYRVSEEFNHEKV